MNLKSYPTDLTDAQWEKLLPYLPEPSPVGRPLKWEMRSIINAMFYLLKSGCQWQCYLIRCHRGKRSIPTSESGKLMVHGL